MLQEFRIFLVPVLVAAAWSVRIFLKKDTSRVQLLLSAEMMMAAMSLLFSGKTALFIFPFIYLAVRQKTASEGITRWDFLTFLPAFVFIPFPDTVIFEVFFLAEAVAISVYAAVATHRYNRHIAEYYDVSGDISADDLNQALIYIISSGVVLAVMMMPQVSGATFWLPYVLTAFLVVLQFMTGLCIFQMKEPELPGPELPEPELEETPAVAPAASMQADSPGSELLQKVVDDKMYLDPALSLVSLADRLHTNRTYLSNAIHSCDGKNFSEYINYLRIQYALELMKEEGPETSIKDIAIRSGYVHIQSFYRNFTEIMEMTPKQWLSK